MFVHAVSYQTIAISRRIVMENDPTTVHTHVTQVRAQPLAIGLTVPPPSLRPSPERPALPLFDRDGVHRRNTGLGVLSRISYRTMIVTPYHAANVESTVMAADPVIAG